MSTMTSAGHFRTDSLVEKIISKRLFWLVFVVFGFTYPIVRSIYRELPPELPIYSHLPEFQLTSENGTPFGSNDLKGKAYMAGFFFTSCPTVCPKITSAMKGIEKRISGLGTKVAMVTFTVDPVTDNPKVLFKKARELKANSHLWSFLTGSENDLKSLLIDGFKVPMSDKSQLPGSLYDIAHTEKLVLVDTLGRIRGYYSIDNVSVDKLMINLGLLINRPVTKE